MESTESTRPRRLPRYLPRHLLDTIAAVVVIGAAVTTYNASVAEEKAPPPAAAAAPAAVPVDVQTVAPRDVRLWASYSGRMRAVDYAQVRPEVGGRIMEVKFADGQIVQAGDILFVIDPSSYEAAVAKAEANLASARTNATFAAAELERAGDLVRTKAVAQRTYDERLNASRMAQAAIRVAEAELKQARLDLDHAYVKAPIGGRVSRAEITAGNLVQAGPTAPVLTSIVSNQGIYADFEVDEQTYLKSLRARGDTRDKVRGIAVELTVPGDEGRTVAGTLESFDNRIDTASGTIRARARFDNRDGTLVPGMFVSVRLATDGGSAALLVPERAVGNDQSKKFVYVVGDDSKVAYREVRLGQTVEGQRIVLAGLNSGDKVIVSGLQKVRPAVTVAANEAQADRLSVASRPAGN